MERRAHWRAAAAHGGVRCKDRRPAFSPRWTPSSFSCTDLAARASMSLRNPRGVGSIGLHDFRRSIARTVRHGGCWSRGRDRDACFAGKSASHAATRSVRDWIRRGNVPTEFIVEQLLMMLSRGDDARYQLLAEPSGRTRARFALSELTYLANLLDRAAERAAPAGRGISAN